MKEEEKWGKGKKGQGEQSQTTGSIRELEQSIWEGENVQSSNFNFVTPKLLQIE